MRVPGARSRHTSDVTSNPYARAGGAQQSQHSLIAGWLRACPGRALSFAVSTRSLRAKGLAMSDCGHTTTITGRQDEPSGTCRERRDARGGWLSRLWRIMKWRPGWFHRGGPRVERHARESAVGSASVTTHSVGSATDRACVTSARERMLSAREESDRAAAEYRAVVSQVVTHWRRSGISQRCAAERLGLSEGALRQLLRPPGQPRRPS